jgi:hypothetical protein
MRTTASLRPDIPAGDVRFLDFIRVTPDFVGAQTHSDVPDAD